MTCSSAAKSVLIVFNCLFFIVGAILLAVGFYVLFTPYSLEIFAVLDNGIIQAGVYCIIVIGVVIFIIAGLGLCGALCQSKPLIVIYLVIIFIIMVTQVGICAAVVQYRTRVNTFVSESLIGTMDNYINENSTNSSYTVGWNSMQIYFECCGTNGYQDWSNTTWGRDNAIFKYQAGAEYPITCCAVTDTNVVFSGMVEPSGFRDQDKCYGDGEAIPNMYMAGNGTTGCFTAFENYVVSNIQLLGAVGIGLAAFEIILFILGLVVCCTIDKKEEVV